jgi:hypothetical protein
MILQDEDTGETSNRDNIYVHCLAYQERWEPYECNGWRNYGKYVLNM